MKSITFLMPPFQYSPVGGFKIALEYANRLVDDGFEVHVVYGDTTKYKKLPYKLKFKFFVKHILFRFHILHRSIRIWFPLDERIKEHNVYGLDYRFVPKTDLYICTGVDTAAYLNKYPISSVRKFYFIQGYENWGRSDEEVRQTYHYPMKKIAVSKWLHQIIASEEGEPCIWVPNGFDCTKFYLTIPIEQKNKYAVSMLYHEAKIKGCETAFSALHMVKKEIPNLQVVLFGTPERPKSLPEWFTYYRQPSEEVHLKINNETAIYVAASINEGWGLTIGEAMLCGQAVVCSDNKGFREMAKDEETALLFPVGDAEEMAQKIIRLIKDDDLRIRIANRGKEFINAFEINKSYTKFKAALGLNE